MYNQCYLPEEREQRDYLELLRNHITSLPAEIYNNNQEFWQKKLAEEEKILDDMISARLS